MKISKKVLLLLLTLALLNLTACKNENTESTSGSDSTSTSVGDVSSETSISVPENSSNGIVGVESLETSGGSDSETTESADASSVTEVSVPESSSHLISEVVPSETESGDNEQAPVNEQAPLKEEVYKGFPNETKFEEPRIGGNTVLKSVSDYGVTASVVLMCIGEFPEESNDGMWAADGVYIVIRDSSGKTAYERFLNGMVGGDGPVDHDRCNPHSHHLNPGCVTGNSTRLFEVEQNGKKHVILMQYININNGLDVMFYDCDLKDYPDFSDGSDVTNRILGYSYWVNIPHSFSGSFEFVEGTTFKDPVSGYNYVFDCEKREIKLEKT